jgi:hypothetical protein
MVSVVIFPCEGVFGSTTFRIVAGEPVFFVGMTILVVTFEVNLPVEYIMFTVASRILATKTVRFDTSYEDIRIEKETSS